MGSTRPERIDWTVGDRPQSQTVRSPILSWLVAPALVFTTNTTATTIIIILHPLTLLLPLRVRRQLGSPRYRLVALIPLRYLLILPCHVTNRFAIVYLGSLKI
ncbi:uncharacterized protein BO97DRAFT_26823 [Aspergillus homomorphus CBS 101889]|uniref:Uncharacterized protein n=1 Tax=Aspergillus homomorphus (strain CBS 101889) TaxID=1450537 RepID=A0A395I3P2_ASPHC|nr:hypothetical protein BO97DRAFT_26823 [Aspergillus homomorphus CBS 101889]RAL13808.1 hypothetical protein BO97DRAFT_26823 [Aspergillus homomorphus CBS 101889]